MLKIKTSKLQEMISRAMKAAVNDKLRPLTSFLALELKDSTFTIKTTDEMNNLFVREQVEGDDFYVCVSVDTFPKLISKLTCEDVILDLKENYLEVTGNGKYKIEYQLDENGEMVQFPNTMTGLDGATKVGEIKLSTIKSIISTIKPSLAPGNIQYSEYYVGDTITASDSYKISSMATKVFDKPQLIAPATMDLLGTMVDDTIDIYMKDEKYGKVLFDSPHGVLVGYTSDKVDSYAIDAILGLVNTNYPSKCKISKAEILQVLDRMSLFVDTLVDTDIISLAFEEDGLVISSNKSNGSEKISYIECDNFQECSGIVLLNRLDTQIKAQSGDTVNIHFGNEDSIKMVDNNITLVVALGIK